MEPSEIRARVLADHARLRGELDRLETLGRSAARPDATEHDAIGLRAFTQAFVERLLEHMAWEERYLLPALREADAWGRERAERLVADHREQRHLLHFIVERLCDRRRPDVLVMRDVDGLVSFLREDMEEEERDLLDPRVLRDDVIGIEVETG